MRPSASPALSHSDQPDAPPCPLARDMLAALAAGETSAEAVVTACFARIDAREPSLGAWICLDRDGAQEQARRWDKARRLGDKLPPLAGLPIGIKDNIDTAGLPTGYGSTIYDGHRPRADAACVAQARNAGAIVVGKTVTTEFAYYSPGKTVNPHNSAHTPGGSSQGSAAAVASGMVPIALGTQTAGSVIRPAAYCGVVGFKPSWGLIPRPGVKLLSDWLDTIGVFTRDVSDAAFFLANLTGRPTLRVDETGSPYTVAVLREPYPGTLEPEGMRALDHAAEALAAGGHKVVDMPTPAVLQPLARLQRLVMAYDMDKALGYERREHESKLSSIMRTYLDEGKGTAARAYDAALATTRDAIGGLDDWFGSADAILSPSAPGEAPQGLHATGDPAFNRIWSLLQLPCLTLPAGSGPNGLPVGVQLAARHGQDGRLLAVARAAEAALGR